MEFLQRAKIFRLKCSHQSKYLTADQDEETIRLSRENSSTYTRWSYEQVEGKTNVIRLKSSHSWKYLAISEEQYLFGMTGKRVAQRPYLGPTVEWEPIKEGPYIKLKSYCGSFLRGNRGPPPWRNTVTHDVSGHWTASESMILWIVDIIEIHHRSTHGLGSLSSNVVDQKALSNYGDGDGAAENMCSSLEHSASFNKLKSMLDSLDHAHYDAERQETLHTEKILPSDVKIAKQTLKKLVDMDFHTILTLNRYEDLENTLNTISNSVKTSKLEKISNDYVNLLQKLKAMKNDHELATQDFNEYASFSDLRSEIKAELDKDVIKASVLEATLEKWYNDESKKGGIEREELVKQLEATESSIKAVEVLKTRIEKKNKTLMEMEAMEESWQATKVEAQLNLDRVEKDWVKIKSLFNDEFLFF